MPSVPVVTGDAVFQNAATGDFYANDGETHLLVENTSGGGKRVRLEVQSTPLDPATPSIDHDETVANGTYRILEAVHPRWYNRADGTVLVSYPDGNSGLRVSALLIKAARTY